MIDDPFVLDETAEDDEVDEVDQEDRRKTKALRDLQEHPGWVILREIVEAQIKTREQTVLYKPLTAESIYEIEYKKGEINGMRTLMYIPSQIVDDEVALRKHKEQQDAE